MKLVLFYGIIFSGSINKTKDDPVAFNKDVKSKKLNLETNFPALECLEKIVDLETQQNEPRIIKVTRKKGSQPVNKSPEHLKTQDGTIQEHQDQIAGPSSSKSTVDVHIGQNDRSLRIEESPDRIKALENRILEPRYPIPVPSSTVTVAEIHSAPNDIPLRIDELSDNTMTGPYLPTKTMDKPSNEIPLRIDEPVIHKDNNQKTVTTELKPQVSNTSDIEVAEGPKTESGLLFIPNFVEHNLPPSTKNEETTAIVKNIDITLFQKTNKNICHLSETYENHLCHINYKYFTIETEVPEEKEIEFHFFLPKMAVYELVDNCKYYLTIFSLPFFACKRIPVVIKPVENSEIYKITIKSREFFEKMLDNGSCFYIERSSIGTDKLYKQSFLGAFKKIKGPKKKLFSSSSSDKDRYYTTNTFDQKGRVAYPKNAIIKFNSKTNIIEVDHKSRGRFVYNHNAQNNVFLFYFFKIQPFLCISNKNILEERVKYFKENIINTLQGQAPFIACFKVILNFEVQSPQVKANEIVTHLLEILIFIAKHRHLFEKNNHFSQIFAKKNYSLLCSLAKKEQKKRFQDVVNDFTQRTDFTSEKESLFFKLLNELVKTIFFF